jgi:hypothetical protein
MSHLVMHGFTTMHLGFYIMLGFLVKGLFITQRAEVVRLPLIGRFIGSCLRIYFHPTYWIFFHSIHFLSSPSLLYSTK